MNKQPVVNPLLELCDYCYEKPNVDGEACQDCIDWIEEEQIGNGLIFIAGASTIDGRSRPPANNANEWWNLFMQLQDFSFEITKKIKAEYERREPKRLFPFHRG